MTSQARFEKMRAILVDSNPFYSKRLAKNVPFSKIPFTTKSEIVEDQLNHAPFGTNLTYPLQAYTRMHQTSGTTGKPLRWLDTPESWSWWLDCWSHVYRGAGVRRGDRVYVAFSFAPFIGFWTAFEAAQHMGVLVLSGSGVHANLCVASR